LDKDDRPPHLIERAAARLQTLGSVSAAATIQRSSEVTSKQPSEVLKRELPTEPISMPSEVVDAPRQSLRVNDDALARAGLLSREAPHYRLAEEFRIVESKLLRQAFGENRASDAGWRSNLMLVTSALAGEGKSFISMNIAAGLAQQSGRRVILVDADAKPGGLGQLLLGSETPGLLDLARQTGLDVGNLLVGTAVNNLDVLPLGTDVGRSAEQFASPQMLAVLRDLGRRYADGIILLDGPPALSSSVPHALAEVIGQIVFVVAAGSTQQEDLEAALGLLQACPEIWLLLNKVPLWNAHSFGLYNYPQA
jgi:Mrp family chromosome partitioning ATPase